VALRLSSRAKSRDLAVDGKRHGRSEEFSC
jgi:hypothetical protein